MLSPVTRGQKSLIRIAECRPLCKHPFQIPGRAEIHVYVNLGQGRTLSLIIDGDYHPCSLHHLLGCQTRVGMRVSRSDPLLRCPSLSAPPPAPGPQLVHPFKEASGRVFGATVNESRWPVFPRAPAWSVWRTEEAPALVQCPQGARWCTAQAQSTGLAGSLGYSPGRGSPKEALALRTKVSDPHPDG